MDAHPCLDPAQAIVLGEKLLKEGDRQCHYATRPMFMGHDWGSCMNDEIQIIGHARKHACKIFGKARAHESFQTPLSFCVREGSRGQG